MDMTQERHAYLQAKERTSREAGVRFALLRGLGLDLEAARRCGEKERSELSRRLRRLIERERLRGLARHWSYDLNRHISLKQALDELRA